MSHRFGPDAVVIQGGNTNAGIASVVPTVDDPTKNGLVAVNPDGSTITGAGGGGGTAGTEYTEDAASVANPKGGQLILRRRDTLSGAEVDTDGDVIAANATAKGEQYVKASDTDTLVGAVTETAPASDTASSGLNGRLQRIAQRITSLIAATLATSVADGSNVALGTTTDAKTTGDSSGTASAKLRGLTYLLGLVTDTINSRLKVDGSAVTQPVSAVAGGIADGGIATIGLKADAKSTATDTTAITAMSVWKQISASVQLFVFGAGTAAAAQRTTLASDDPAVATLGATSGAKVITDANGTIQQYLRGLIYLLITSGQALVTASLAAGSNLIGSVTAKGGAATNVAITDNPLNQGAQAVSSENAAVTTGRMVQLVADLVGKLIVLPYANPENMVSGAITSAMVATTSTSLVAAPGAGLRNYITTFIVSNAHATVSTDVVIQDGSGGTTLLTIPAAAVYGGAVITLPTPLRQPTANTALFCANVTTGASTKVSAVGYKGA